MPPIASVRSSRRIDAGPHPHHIRRMTSDSPQHAQPSSRVDVFISGGGPAGQTLALALAQAGARVAMADAQSPTTTLAPHFDGRAFAIAFANMRMWKALGVADDLMPHAQPIEKILVTDGRPTGNPRGGGVSLAHLFFDRQEIAPGETGEPLGYMLENRYIRLALDRAVRAQSETIRFIAPMKVESFHTAAAGVSVRLADGEVIAADLLVGADGRKSFVRESLDIATVGWPYPVTAIVATVRHEKPHGGVAHELFLPAGPFAILPLTGNRANVVWAEKHPVAQAILAMDEQDFLAELRLRFGDFLGQVCLEGPRFGYPLALQLAEKMIASRAALVADAAHGIHPIAGQGLNIGLKDVAALAECIADSLSLGLDAADPAGLERYQRWRRMDNVAMAAATDFFDRLFSNDSPVLRLGRRAGLAAVNTIGPARRFFMRTAGGAGGELPRLLKGESLAV
jgi:2-octaprenyl-6-methoxyphenol hydroxylase